MKTLLSVLLLLVLVSCATSKKATEKKPLFEILTQQPTGGASIRFFEILSEPNEIKMLRNDDELKGKIKESDVQTSNFIILNMGEQATGGYQISIESVVEMDKNISVTVKEITPNPDEIVSQDITTPYCVVKINSKKEIIVK